MPHVCVCITPLELHSCVLVFIYLIIFFCSSDTLILHVKFLSRKYGLASPGAFLVPESEETEIWKLRAGVDVDHFWKFVLMVVTTESWSLFFSGQT
jgi:hypothetical protein